MFNSTWNEVTINNLNNECLEHIFLYIPISQRIQLRKVCKKWCEVSDGCWRKIQQLQLKGRREEYDEILDNGRAIVVFTNKHRLASGFMNRCGPFLTSLDGERIDGKSILPIAHRKCRNLKELNIPIASVIDQLKLSQLLPANKQISQLRLNILINEYSYFKHLTAISASALQEFQITLAVSGEPAPRILTCIVKILRDANALRNFSCNHMNNEALRAVSEKVNLESFTLGGLHSALVTINGLAYISNMSNLKNLNIDTCAEYFWRDWISDHFIRAISNNCKMLEKFALRDHFGLRNDGVLALSTLPRLRELRIRCALSITDAPFKYLSNLTFLSLYMCKGVGDTGLVELLEKSKVIEVLDLEGTKVTNKTMITANQEMKNRTNDTSLNLILGGTKANISELQDKSPLLILKIH